MLGPYKNAKFPDLKDMVEYDEDDEEDVEKDKHATRVNVLFQKAIDALLDPSLCADMVEARIELQEMSDKALAANGPKGEDAKALEQKILKTEEMQVAFLRVLSAPGTLQLLSDESLTRVIKVTEHYLVKKALRLDVETSLGFYAALLRFFMQMTDEPFCYDEKKNFRWTFDITAPEAYALSTRFHALYKLL
jgi:hypothetical protein